MEEKEENEAEEEEGAEENFGGRQSRMQAQKNHVPTKKQFC